MAMHIIVSSQVKGGKRTKERKNENNLNGIFVFSSCQVGDPTLATLY